MAQTSLPVYVDPAEGFNSDPDVRKTYPLILNTGARIQSTFRSGHQSIPSRAFCRTKRRLNIAYFSSLSALADSQSVTISAKRYLADFDTRDPISGFPVFKVLLREIERV
jgi:hypothetical protein